MMRCMPLYSAISRAIWRKVKPMTIKTLKKRLRALTWKRADNQCWPYLGYRDTRGSGKIFLSTDRGAITVEHAVKLLELGAIPDGLFPLSCPLLKDCCNPAHIGLG